MILFPCLSAEHQSHYGNILQQNWEGRRRARASSKMHAATHHFFSLRSLLAELSSHSQYSGCSHIVLCVSPGVRHDHQECTWKRFKMVDFTTFHPGFHSWIFCLWTDSLCSISQKQSNFLSNAFKYKWISLGVEKTTYYMWLCACPIGKQNPRRDLIVVSFISPRHKWAIFNTKVRPKAFSPTSQIQLRRNNHI